MRRWLFIFLAVVLSGWFAPTAHALTRASAPDAQPRYDESPQIWIVVVDVGITMDTDEGDNEDPLSLHKYLYCSANPVNMHDPSGHDGDVISLDVAINIAVGLTAFSAASIYEAQTHALGNLAVAAYYEASSDGASAAAAAESALSVFRTSVRELIDEAKDVLTKSGRVLNHVKIVPMPKSVIPNIASHVALAQASGSPIILTRVSPTTRRANYVAAVAGLGSAGLFRSWDEYPFASGRLPGTPVSVASVPMNENFIQGGIISACYTLEKINVGTPYVVVVTP